MRNWTISARIVSSFVVILALMLTMGIASYVRLIRIQHHAAALQNDSFPSEISNQILVERIVIA